jgi:virulence factor Mce-like protein
VIKQAPSIGRILAMVVFTLSCIGLLLFLWLTFGGSIPLKPEGYRVKAAFQEAATLAVEADVRMAGVNVGKVKTKELDKGAARTLVELELKPQYAPIPKNSKAILRQKTLLGETYVEISTGDRQSGMLEDGDTLPNNQVEPTVELDEIFNAFDEETRDRFKEWVAELTKAIRNQRGEDLNNAFGNLEGLAVDGAKLLEVLDEQDIAVRRLIKNTGVVFGALNERQGQLRDLIVNSNNTFEATASRDEALAETFQVFPTFLDESRVTLARLEDFSRSARPVVNDLKAPADDLAPTLRDLGDLAPDLEALFRDLNPLIRSSRRGLPDLERVVRGAEPLFEAAHVFFPELNPILSYLNFHQATVAGFFTLAGANLNSTPGGERVQVNTAIIEERSFETFPTMPEWDRGNAYLAPNGLARLLSLGAYESIVCPEGERRAPDDEAPLPPCFQAPPSLYDGQIIPSVERGRAPKVDAPQGQEGNSPARP